MYYYTASQYIDEFTEQQKKNTAKYPMYFAKANVGTWLGKSPQESQTFVGIEMFKTGLEGVKISKKAIQDEFRKNADAYIARAAVDDLVLYSGQIGLSVIKARKLDLADQEAGMVYTSKGSFEQMARNKVEFELELEMVMDEMSYESDETSPPSDNMSCPISEASIYDGKFNLTDEFEDEDDNIGANHD